MIWLTMAPIKLSAQQLYLAFQQTLSGTLIM